MISKQRVRAVMTGQTVSPPMVALYITWPEYGWRFSGHKCWELVLGDVDAIAVYDRVFQRYPSDFAPGLSIVWAIAGPWTKSSRPKRTRE